MTVETEFVILASLFIDVSNRSIRASILIHTLLGKDARAARAVATERISAAVFPFMTVVILFGSEAKAERTAETPRMIGDVAALKVVVTL